MKRLYITKWLFNESDTSNTSPLKEFIYANDTLEIFGTFNAMMTVSPDVDMNNGIVLQDLCIEIIDAEKEFFDWLDKQGVDWYRFPAIDMKVDVLEVWESTRTKIADELVKADSPEIDWREISKASDIVNVLMKRINSLESIERYNLKDFE